MSIRAATKQGLAMEGQWTRRSNSDSLYSARFIKFRYSLSCWQFQQFWKWFSQHFWKGYLFFMPYINVSNKKRQKSYSGKSEVFIFLVKLSGKPKKSKLLQEALQEVLKGNNIIALTKIPRVIIVVLMGWLAASRCMMWCLTRLPQACRTSPNWVSTNQALLLLFNHISISAPNCEVNLSSLLFTGIQQKWNDMGSNAR